MRSPVFGLAATGYDSGCRQPPHAHDELQITLVLRGVLEEKVGTTAERASAFSVVVKDPGVTHADEFGCAGTLTARLWVRDTTIAELVEHPSRARASRRLACPAHGARAGSRGRSSPRVSGALRAALVRRRRGGPAT